MIIELVAYVAFASLGCFVCAIASNVKGDATMTAQHLGNAACYLGFFTLVAHLIAYRKERLAAADL